MLRFYIGQILEKYLDLLLVESHDSGQTGLLRCSQRQAIFFHEAYGPISSSQLCILVETVFDTICLRELKRQASQVVKS